MRRYETIIIIDPDTAEELRSGLIERVNELIPRHGGFMIEVDDWGQRRMAYEIRKKLRGHYTRIDFCGDGALVDEMERNFRIDDRILKYMTVLIERNADVDAIKETMEMEKAKKESENNPPPEQRNTSSDQTDEAVKPTDPIENKESEATEEE